MIPEFIGRLPVVSSLDALTEDEMVAILTETKSDGETVHEAFLQWKVCA